MPLAVTTGTLALWHHLNDLHPALINGNFSSHVAYVFCACVSTDHPETFGVEGIVKGRCGAAGLEIQSRGWVDLGHELCVSMT